MTTITIAKSVKEEFVLVPKKEYERLLGIKAKQIKPIRKLAVKKKDYDPDASIRQALKEIERGDVYGPFTSAKELMVSLRAKN